MTVLGDVCTVVSSLVDPTIEPYADMPHVAPGLITSGGDFNATPRSARASGVRSGKYLFQPGDVLYSKIRPALNKVVIADFAGVCSADMYALRVREARLDARYLLHRLRSKGFVEYAATRSGRLSIPKINRPALLEYRLDDLPAIEEQRRIGAILDQADALRAKRREALAQLDDLPPAIFASMFGHGDEALGRWTTKELGDLLDFLTSGSRGWAKYYAASGDLFIRIQNVQRDELVLDDVAFVNTPSTAEAERTRVRPGDVLLSITADLGRTAVVPNGLGAAYINQHLAILRAPSVNSQFLSSFLSSPAGQKQILRRNRQAVKAGLNFDDIRSVRVPLPPLNLQHLFARRASQVQEQRERHQQSASTLKKLGSSLQAQAFSGRL